jgi:acyl phosphate:glycerol-3-phosphate acyltransferase
LNFAALIPAISAFPHLASVSASLLDLPLSVPPPWWLPLAAYLLGSIPFGFLIVEVTGRGDIRKRGSGNVGATNVARVAGIAPGVATLLLDTAKGYAAVWIAARVTEQNIRWMMLAALLAMVGHLFPVWLGFHGGKGVATGLGVFVPICWQAVVVAVLIWILVVVFWRFVSLASISAAAALPLLIYVLYAPGHAPPVVVTAGTLAAMVLVIMRHAPNIQRLLSGTEPQITIGRARRQSPEHDGDSDDDHDNGEN